MPEKRPADRHRGPAVAANGIYLVSCTKGKLAGPAPARDLYSKSSWFRKARAYVEKTGQPWFVLSAKHGLVHPNEVIEWYELALSKDFSTEQRQHWARRVLSQLSPHLNGVDCITFLAGQQYRQYLEKPLRDQGLVVCAPMEHVPWGGQQPWLDQQFRKLCRDTSA